MPSRAQGRDLLAARLACGSRAVLAVLADELLGVGRLGAAAVADAGDVGVVPGGGGGLDIVAVGAHLDGMLLVVKYAKLA